MSEAADFTIQSFEPTDNMAWLLRVRHLVARADLYRSILAYSRLFSLMHKKLRRVQQVPLAGLAMSYLTIVVLLTAVAVASRGLVGRWVLSVTCP
jgi:hypothetical protein